MRKNHTILNLIISIIISLAVIGLFIFFLQIIQNKNKHTSVVASTLEDKITEKANIENLKRQVSEITTTQKTVVNYFVDPAKIDTFVEYLETLNKNSNTKLVVKSVEMVPKTKNTIAVRVLIDAPFKNIMQSMVLLENMPYQIHITSAFLNKTIMPSLIDGKEVKKTAEVPMWQADISFNILSL